MLAMVRDAMPDPLSRFSAAMPDSATPRPDWRRSRHPRRAALDSRQAHKQSRRTGASALGREGNAGTRCRTGHRCAHHLAANATATGMTDDGRRGDSKYRSAARPAWRL
jgi:hypothetical protein